MPGWPVASSRQGCTTVKFPKTFFKEPVFMVFKVDKSSIDIVGIFPRFLENLLENESDKNLIGCLPV